MSRAILLGSAALLAIQCGCAIPQRPGLGVVGRKVESTTHTGYWLYLPEGYNTSDSRDDRTWPVVVTFHGTKPFDSANPQIREWQEEADRYGFIVIAPELRTPDVFMQFPLKDPNLSYLQHDERATLAIMDKVFSETRADPSRVLCTGWSTGGYIAHYMVNRNPDRFCCLAVRESPFSEGLLDESQVPKYRNMRVAIYCGENDFAVCQKGSKQALEWYRNHGFSVEVKTVAGTGHVRIPYTVAAFYASTIGVTPKSPPIPGNYVTKQVRSSQRRQAG